MSIRMSSPGGGAPAPQYTPNQIAAMLANPQYRGQAEQFLSSTFGRIAPQASERTYTLRGMTSSDDNGTLINQTPYYTDQNISSWYGAGDWTAGREGRFAGTQAPTGDFMAVMSGQGDEFNPGFQTTGYTVDLTPDFRDERGYGRYVGDYDAQGNLTGLRFQSRNLSQGWLGDNMDVWGPLLVGGAAALGAGGFLPGMAGETAAAAGGGQAAAFTPGMTAGPAMSTIPGAGGSAISIPGLTTSGVNAGAMSHMAGSLGADMIAAGVVPGFSGALASEAAALAGPLATQAAQAPQVGSMGGAAGGGGAAPSPGKTLLDTAKAIGEYAAPAASLLSSASTLSGVQQPRMPDMIKPEAPPVPGANAPAEARGYQPGQNPILEVLGRGRGKGRSAGGTMLTGPGGVNMASTRVGANTLLGM